ncbi:MAG: hypothetical protein R3Y11_00100 [Pseudomonadota bacterium]
MHTQNTYLLKFRRIALILALCLVTSTLCTACFVTARNADEVTVGGGITF